MTPGQYCAKFRIINGPLPNTKIVAAFVALYSMFLTCCDLSLSVPVFFCAQSSSDQILVCSLERTLNQSDSITN